MYSVHCKIRQQYYATPCDAGLSQFILFSLWAKFCLHRQERSVYYIHFCLCFGEFQYFWCHTESTGAGLFATLIASLTSLLFDIFFLLTLIKSACWLLPQTGSICTEVTATCYLPMMLARLLIFVQEIVSFSQFLDVIQFILVRNSCCGSCFFFFLFSSW